MDVQPTFPLVVRLVRSGHEYFYHANGRGYVDLDDLKDMRSEGETFMIRDEETGEDLTRILLT